MQQRIINATDGRQFVFRCTMAARDFLLREGTDMKFGARHLKRSIERHLVFPISNLLATEQIQLGDLITVDFDTSLGKLIFVKEDQGALVHAEEETTARNRAGAGARASRRSFTRARPPRQPGGTPITISQYLLLPLSPEGGLHVQRAPPLRCRE